jgi:adenylate cyclase
LLESERRLAVIMFTDMVGFTSMAQRNEASAIGLLEEQRSIVRPFFARHGGREVKTIGDAFLVEFASALEAVRCAVEIQSLLRDENSRRPEGKRIIIRIGIHLGDVIHSGSDIAGDAVNVASRIEPLAPPGGVCLTGPVRSAVINKVECEFESLGAPELKNVVTPIEVYRVRGYGSNVAPMYAKEAQGEDRVAILPFANLSPDPAEDYFTDGMTEEVISAVSKLQSLRVISRTSVMRYKRSDRTMSEIGRELNVTKLLEGSVRKLGNRLRVSVQLIDAKTDQHIWAETYDRDLSDVFSIQIDIAKQIADALRVEIRAPEMGRLTRRPTDSTASYSLYLKGRSCLNKRGLQDITEAKGYFEKALAEDRNLALGYVGLGDCFQLLAANWQVDIEQNREKAMAMVDRALELDQGLAEAHATRGLALSGEFKLREAEEEFKKAIECKPNYSPAHLWYSQLLLAELRWAEGFEHVEKVVELDPLLPTASVNLGIFYFAMRDYAKALQFYRRSTDLDPKFASGHFGSGWAYGKMGMYEEARREYKIGVELLRDSYPLVKKQAEAWIAWIEDDKESVRRILPELEENPSETLMDAMGIAELHFYLGEKDKGFEWLGRSYSKKEEGFMYIQSDEFLEGVRSDPRYEDLLRRAGLNTLVGPT